MVLATYGDRPVLMTMTLIPWYGRLVYDGVVVPAGPFGIPIREASADLLVKLQAAVQTAIAEGRVVERLLELEVPGGSLEGVTPGRTPNQTRPSEEEQPPATGLGKKLVRKVSDYPPMSSDDKWVFRRVGYDEMSNPDHIGVVMVRGDAIGAFQSSSLQPRAEDILRSLIMIARKFGKGKRPTEILVDERSCCQCLRFLLRESSLSVAYIDPPLLKRSRLLGLFTTQKTLDLGEKEMLRLVEDEK